MWHDPTTEGLEYEAGLRHSVLIVRVLGLEGAKSSSTAYERKAAPQIAEDDEAPPLDPAGTSLYRSVVTRASYLAQDRTDLWEAVKTFARFV